MKIDQEKMDLLKRLNKEGNSTSSMSRLLGISKSSVQRKLIELGSRSAAARERLYEKLNQQYEVDELKTYIGRTDNECWVIYAINKATRKVIDFKVGRRTKENIKKVIHSVLKLHPKKIYTDHLNIYPTLIDAKIHRPSQYHINRIERKNLDLRKDLKCLNRQTICYAKSEKMLTTKLQLYFFGSCLST